MKGSKCRRIKEKDRERRDDANAPRTRHGSYAAQPPPHSAKLYKTINTSIIKYYQKTRLL